MFLQRQTQKLAGEEIEDLLYNIIFLFTISNPKCCAIYTIILLTLHTPHIYVYHITLPFTCYKNSNERGCRFLGAKAIHIYSHCKYANTAK